MKNRLENPLIFFQVISFIPFFFGVFVFISQTIADIRTIINMNEYKPGIFIVTDKIIESSGSTAGIMSYDSVAIGSINNVSYEIFLTRIKEYKKKVNINDTIYAWYREGGYILVRKKEDTTFHITQYMQRDLQGLMLFGIPPFIIIAFVRRRMKKKAAKQNNTIKT